MKKTLALVLTALMVSSLTACGFQGRIFIRRFFPRQPPKQRPLLLKQLPLPMLLTSRSAPAFISLTTPS
jgi:hypothetical protein